MRNFLKDHLPPYAIPGTFCVIDALPVNQSAAGKLDRKHVMFSSPDTTARLEAFNVDDNDEFRRIAPSNPTELALLTIFAELLQTPQDELSAGDNFFDVGGHSLLATRLVSKINEHWFQKEKTFKLKHVMDVPTVVGVSANIQHCLNSNSTTSGDAGTPGGGQAVANENKEEDTIDLDAEATMLDGSIYPAATRKGLTLTRFRREKALMVPNTVFLTGATGYLGVHILAELIASTSCDVICIVRAKDNAAAMARLKTTLEKYQLSAGMDDGRDSRDGKQQTTTNAVSEVTEVNRDNRVVAIAGDLSKPLLGMEHSVFKEVAGQIDSIIHCGADVNLIKPYSALKATNVLGTQEILRLAVTNSLFSTKVKPLHYISTNGVFPVNRAAYTSSNAMNATNATVLCKEEHTSVQEMANAGYLIEGYARSKYVAETMCTIARTERGLPVSIMRPGNMSGNSSTGLQNVNDFVYLFLNGCIALQMCPSEDCDYYFDLTPVDFAAKVVVNASVHKPSSVIGRTIHLQNPQKPVSLGMVEHTFNEIGHAMKSVTREEFMTALHSKCDAERKSGLRTSIVLQLESGFDAFETYFIASKWLNYDSTSMASTLEETGIVCPAINKAMLLKWFPLK